MKQETFAMSGFEKYSKTTKRAAFLAEKEECALLIAYKANPMPHRVAPGTLKGRRYGRRGEDGRGTMSVLVETD